MKLALRNPTITTVRAGDTEVRLALPSTTDHISNVLKTSGGFYESPFLEAVAGVLSPDDLVLDVGANIGNHSLYFAKVLGCKVIAFEPVASTADILYHNVELNFADANIEVRFVAVGRQPGRASIKSYDPANIGATELAETIDGEITVTSLDTEKINGRVAFIKIDVEGMDLDVIRGALGLIQRDRPFISCEVATPTGREELRGLLREIGYVIAGVYNATPTYILAPTRTTAENTGLIMFHGHQLQTLRDAQKDLDTRLLRSNRYSERLHREAIQIIDERLSLLNAQSRDSATPEEPLDLSVGSEEMQLTINQLRDTLDQAMNRIHSLESDIAALRAENHE